MKHIPIDLGISKTEFEHVYAGKQPFLARCAFIPQGVTWDHVNCILDRCDVESDDFKIACDGIISKAEYVESYRDVGSLRYRLIKSAVYNYLKTGGTLIANKLKGDPLVEGLAREFGLFTGHQIVSSAYIAFGSQASFRPHWDTRDVFTVQLLGRKRWRVYKPSFEAPLYTQQSKDLESKYPCPEDPLLDFVMEPGDVFYLPRGWWHHPIAVGEGTFHLSLGVFPPLAIDYVLWAVDQVQSYVGARRAIVNWEKGEEIVSDLGAYIADFMRDPNHYRKFEREIISSTRVYSPLAIDSFGDPAANGIDKHDFVRVCSNNTEGLSNGYIIANGTTLHLDASSQALFHEISTKRVVQVGELIDLHPEAEAQKILSAINDLCRQDILEVVRDF